MADMYTRCPSCQSVYQLTGAQMADAAGMVRCGQCGKTFNALAQLFESHPDSADEPLHSTGLPPLLNRPAIAQPELPGVSLEEPEASERGPSLVFPDLDDQAGSATRSWPAMTASVLLGLALLTQAYVHWQTPGSALHNWFTADPSRITLASGAETIQVTSRDMHRHPTLDDAIIISATLRNPSSQPLNWPVLEVRIYDPSQQVLGARRLLPEDYLDNPDQLSRGMAPGVLAPVILEFVVGTTNPSGFDFRFF